MPVHWCPNCSIPYTEAEVEQGLCPDCKVPVDPPVEVRRIGATPVPTVEPAPRRTGPFLLGLVVGCLAGATAVWVALRLDAPLPDDGSEQAAALQAVLTEKTQANNRARQADVARAEAVKALEAAKRQMTELVRNKWQVESARAEAVGALEKAKQQAVAANQQRRETERKLHDALARFADERKRQNPLEPARGQGKNPGPAPALSSVRDWQLLGPFAGKFEVAHDTVYPPEREPVQLKKAYDGFGGPVKWRPYHSVENKIDLAAFFKYRDAGAAYAVSWAHSDVDQEVTLGVGSDDGIRLWINGEKVHDVKGGRQAKAGQDLVKARLKKGWNEVRAKVDNITGTWELYLDFRTADGRQPLKVFSTSSPPTPR